VDQLNSTVQKDEIDLWAVAGVVWQHRWLVFAIAVLFGGVTFAAAYLLPVTYKAEVGITDVRESTSLGAGLLGGQLSGLANLAGVTLGAGGAAEREARAVLRSRNLIEEFIKRKNLAPVLLRDSKKRPTVWRAVNKFKSDILNIREDVRQGVTSVSIEWTDADTAAQWANDFVALANELVRTHALEQAQRNINYLNQQVAKTNVVELQRVIYNLIEGETKTVMVANGRIEYAFRIVDPAVAPELRASPHRSLIGLLGATIGALIGAIFAFIRHSRRQSRAAGEHHKALTQMDVSSVRT
jgi:uncharacterized protein involved in exopolysaccharide biosynthesis